MSPLCKWSLYPDAAPGANYRIGFRPQKINRNDETRKGESACLTLGMLVVKIPPLQRPDPDGFSIRLDSRQSNYHA